ncbi:MAG: glutaminase, partial [Acidimicrobiia bacterium]
MNSLPGPPVRAHVSTGDLPDVERVLELVADAHQRYAPVSDGAVADYIPILAEASPDWFGICVAGVAGRTAAVGDTEQPFSIQSISKPFVFALVCDAIGHEA